MELLSLDNAYAEGIMHYCFHKNRQYCIATKFVDAAAGKVTHGFFWPVARCVGIVFLQLFVSALSGSYRVHQFLVVLVCSADPAEADAVADSQ